MTELNTNTIPETNGTPKFSKKKKIIVLVIILLAALAAFGVWFSGMIGGISKEEAKEIALKQVPGAKEEEMIISNAEFDDMQKKYEVQISHDNKLYDFQILARNGKITEQEMQMMTPATNNATTNNAPAGDDKVVDNIGLEKAKQIAVDSVSGSKLEDVRSAQFENLDGHYCYEVEIRYDNKDYEITIDPVTGDVLGSASESAK